MRMRMRMRMIIYFVENHDYHNMDEALLDVYHFNPNIYSIAFETMKAILSLVYLRFVIVKKYLFLNLNRSKGKQEHSFKYPRYRAT